MSVDPPAVERVERSGAELVTLHAGERRVEVLSLGAHLVGVWTPDRAGRLDNVVLSLRSDDGAVQVDAYRDRARNPYLGATVGRYANRIAGAAFSLDGALHRLAANEGPNQLHGGPDGFDRRRWSVRTSADHDGATVVLGLESAASDQGFPGRLEVEVGYRLTVEGELQILLSARTDAATVVNLTNHAYWNLAGTSAPSATPPTVRDHLLCVAADRVVRVDAALLPTGDLDPVGGTAFDLRRPVRLGAVLDRPELAATGGLDHCLVLGGSTPAATLAHPGSGRRLRIGTDQPGVQVYTSNHGAGPWPRHSAVCLETQHLPDAPNQPGFPSAVLRPGSTYRHRQVVRLDTVDETG